MADAVVETTVEGDVLHVALARPQALNAMNAALLEELVAALRAGVVDAPAILLSGHGRAFCVGEDLRETLVRGDAAAGGAREPLREAFERLQEITRLMTGAPCAVVAAVQGYAVGGGAELALAADLIVAHPGTRFRFPEVGLGHAVTGGISTRLPAAVGLVRAKDILLRGRWVEADEALAIGMVSELAEDPVARGLQLAAELAAVPRRSLRATKAGLEQAAVANQEVVMRGEVDAALYCFDSAEADAAFERFRARG